MTAIVTHGDARSLPFPDDSIDLIVTSPPYFGLRSYTDGGAHYETQIGAEATPGEFIAALTACTAEMARVLKPSGSIFVNLGDKYAGYNGNRGDGKMQKNDRRPVLERGHGLDGGGPIPNKSLMLLPERYRIACVDDLGLIARAVIVWSKPNGLPESVKDRVRRSHEDWVHLTKSPRYFEAVDEIREPHAPATLDRNTRPRHGTNTENRNAVAPSHPLRTPQAAGTEANPLGKLPGSVWSIATQPLRVPAELNVDHFAAFPMEWPRRLVTGWCPREVCTACGEGRRPVTEKGEHVMAGHGGNYAATPNHRGRVTREQAGHHGDGSSSLRTGAAHTITGYACACPDTSAPSTPGIVLDPFGGTGTTALVADVLGRTGISLDASVDYGRIAAWRTTDPREREKAAVGKPSKPLTLIGPAPGPDEIDRFAELEADVWAAASAAEIDELRHYRAAWAPEHDALAALRLSYLAEAPRDEPETTAGAA